MDGRIAECSAREMYVAHTDEMAAVDTILTRTPTRLLFF